MTTHPSTKTILAALVLLVTPLHAQSAANDLFDPNQPPGANGDVHSPPKVDLILPGDKSSEAVKEDDRNPFSLSESEIKGKGDKASNEESKIEEQIAKLRVSGVSPGAKGLRLLLGDMILSEGDIMPPVINEQSLGLRVGSITREAVELIWLEKKVTGLPPRVLTLPIDLRPSVRYVRHGQPAGVDNKESATMKRANAVRVPESVSVSSSAAPDPARSLASAPAARAAGSSALKLSPVAKLGDGTPPSTAPLPADGTPEPESWQHAMGLFNNLATVAEVKK